MVEDRIKAYEEICINLKIISKHKNIDGWPYADIKSYFNWLKLAILSKR